MPFSIVLNTVLLI